MSFTGGVSVGVLPMLTSVGLTSLTEIGNGLTVSFNDALTDLSGLGALTALSGTLFLHDNGQLSDCDAEDFATRLGTTCSSFSSIQCTGVCDCTGNMDDTCP